MPTFSYTLGNAEAGVIDAPSRGDALRVLVARGQTPRAVQEIGVGAGAGLSASSSSSSSSSSALAGEGATSRENLVLARGSMNLVQLAAFMRDLSTGLRAGLPLATALRTLGKQGANKRQKALVDFLLASVEQGKPLSDAMQTIGRPFGALTINLTRAGEASGRLGEVLAHSAKLLEGDVRLRGSIKAATTYPAILAVLVVAAVIIVVTVIVPKILAQVGAQSMTLPWPTRVVQGVAYFFAHYWWAVLFALAAVVFALYRAWHDPKSRFWIDTHLLRVPILGKLLRDIAVARFTRTLATLSGAGIPIVSALNLTKGTLGNKLMESVIGEVVTQVGAGKTIADPLERSGVFPSMLVQLVHMGERSGKLSELLDQASDAFEERTQQSVKAFTAILPPVLVVVLAGVVGFVVLAILMALLAAQDAAMAG